MPYKSGATLVDSNIFIQAKNLYYRFDFCQGFWDWIVAAHAAGHLYSCKKVKAELLNGNADDPARIWALSLPATFFLDDEQDGGVMQKYATLMQWSIATDYTPAAKADFAHPEKADAFLIAVACQHGLKVATHEKFDANTKRKIPIPNAAHPHGVQTEYVYDLLSRLALPTFALKP